MGNNTSKSSSSKSRPQTISYRPVPVPVGGRFVLPPGYVPHSHFPNGAHPGLPGHFIYHPTSTLVPPPPAPIPAPVPGHTTPGLAPRVHWPSNLPRPHRPRFLHGNFWKRPSTAPVYAFPPHVLPNGHPALAHGPHPVPTHFAPYGPIPIHHPGPYPACYPQPYPGYHQHDDLTGAKQDGALSPYTAANTSAHPRAKSPAPSSPVVADAEPESNMDTKFTKEEKLVGICYTKGYRKGYNKSYKEASSVAYRETYEKAYREFYDEAYALVMSKEYKLGYVEGVEQGLEQGMQQAREQAVKDAKEQGRDQGFEKGYADKYLYAEKSVAEDTRTVVVSEPSAPSTPSAVATEVTETDKEEGLKESNEKASKVEKLD